MQRYGTYPGDGRDGEHFEHGGGQVPEALEEVDEHGAPAAAGGVDVLLASGSSSARYIVTVMLTTMSS